MKTFNTSELRLSIFGLLSAKDLLVVQCVCRCWYRTVALEKMLQQRLFLAPGPGKLVMSVHDDKGPKMAIQPRNENQLRHAEMLRQSFGDGPMHILSLDDGNTAEKTCKQFELESIPIILNPFFTKFWPQDPTNMTNSPIITIKAKEHAASWRRMQLTCPPMLQ
jgi:hypothetical protein